MHFEIIPSQRGEGQCTFQMAPMLTYVPHDCLVAVAIPADALEHGVPVVGRQPVQPRPRALQVLKQMCQTYSSEMRTDSTTFLFEC